MAGLLTKVKNQLTGKRFLVSTIKINDTNFETAVFPANIFFLPQGLRLKNPCFLRQTQDSEEADRIHQDLSQRLRTELPERLFQAYKAA